MEIFTTREIAIFIYAILLLAYILIRKKGKKILLPVIKAACHIKLIIPFGLILKADGTIEGTPVRAGVYKFTILATTNGKGSDELEVVLNVAEKDGGGLLGCNSFVGSTAATMGAMAVCGVLMALKEKRRKNK